MGSKEKISDQQRQKIILEKDYSRYGFKDPETYIYKTPKGLSAEIVEQISKIKNEPKWMTEFRLKAFEHFKSRPMPTWGANISNINFDDFTYYIKSTEKKASNWDDVPETIKKTFERLGVPEAERKFLAGSGAMYESETVYHSIQEKLEKKGVIFTDMDTGLREHEDIVKKFFGTVVPFTDNKFAALNSAVWSGGSFLYVPEGVHIDLPLQAYFRINAARMGQFERTLIIAEKNSSVHYLESCTAPVYSTDSLHAAVVEILAMPGSRVQYTTIQNWSSDVYNLVTKRAYAYEDATVFWIDCNIGSKVTMKYPSVYLLGERAKGEILSVAFAGRGQHIDSGAKAVHLAPNTTSIITSKSISKDGGRTTYRGLVKVRPKATGVKSSVRCDALILDEESASDTIPYMEINEKDVTIQHEASVGKISDEQLFYLMSRGLKENEAAAMIVRGFIEEFTKHLPLDYAVEMNRLIDLEMEGSVG